MAVHWVNYDLRKQGQDYTKLIDYLKSSGTWAKPLKSSFFVSTTLTASQLRDGILEHIDANDVVVVVDVTGDDWAAVGIPQEVADWMKDHLA
ncbi:hypothetical protein [Microbacterium sp. NPDC089696]|uniref:hypothetical protein n=1 Tax=Microbacterium sp. NPDC089696 TaxID=3364199 RepID=UPI0038237811